MLKKNFDQQQDFLQADTADTIPRTQSTLSYTFKCLTMCYNTMILSFQQIRAIQRV